VLGELLSAQPKQKRTNAQKSDPYDSTYLLRPHRDRPSRRAAKRANECSPLDLNCHPTLRRGHACNERDDITLRLRRLLSNR